MQLQQSVIDVLLELQGGPHGVHTSAPFVLRWFLDVLENDTPASLVLELHELLGVLHFLVGSLLEVLAEILEVDVIPVKVVRLSRGRKDNAVRSYTKSLSIVSYQ